MLHVADEEAVRRESAWDAVLGDDLVRAAAILRACDDHNARERNRRATEAAASTERVRTEEPRTAHEARLAMNAAILARDAAASGVGTRHDHAARDVFDAHVTRLRDRCQELRAVELEKSMWNPASFHRARPTTLHRTPERAQEDPPPRSTLCRSHIPTSIARQSGYGAPPPVSAARFVGFQAAVCATIHHHSSHARLALAASLDQELASFAFVCCMPCGTGTSRECHERQYSTHMGVRGRRGCGSVQHQRRPSCAARPRPSIEA